MRAVSYFEEFPLGSRSAEEGNLLHVQQSVGRRRGRNRQQSHQAPASPRRLTMGRGIKAKTERPLRLSASHDGGNNLEELSKSNN
jgi:hypothetical protein